MDLEQWTRRKRNDLGRAATLVRVEMKMDELEAGKERAAQVKRRGSLVP